MLGEFGGCAASPELTSFDPKFPVNREINRKNVQFWPDSRSLICNVGVITVLYRRIP